MAPPKSAKLSKLRSLQEKFTDTLPLRLAQMQDEWEQIKQGGTTPAVLAEFYRSAHSLAGSAGTFNFPRLGEKAKHLELLLRQFSDGDDSVATVTRIGQTFGQLAALAAQGPESPCDIEPLQYPPSDLDAQALIYVLEDDEQMAAESTSQLAHFGYRVETFGNAIQLKEAAGKRVPDALLIDIQLAEGEYAGIEVVAELRDRLKLAVPTIFMSRHSSWTYRLKALRAGGQAYLAKPIDFDQLADQIEVITGRRAVNQYRVLIVEDTLLLAEHYAAVLQNAGMITEIITEPAGLLEVLPAFLPDLVLMDICMPDSNGMEAAQVIRQHGGYTNLPIVYLSTESELSRQLDALRVGGDDFLKKPIDDAHLVSAVAVRVQRFRELSALMNCDGLTGLLNHISLKLALEREVAQAQRNGGDLCFAMLDIDHFKQVNDQYGHPVGDRVIKGLARLLIHRLRKGDIAARYGGEEFAIILPDTPPQGATHLLEELRQAFSKLSFGHAQGYFSVTFSAGIAASPPCLDVSCLIEMADKALYQAKQDGRNQVKKLGRP